MFKVEPKLSLVFAASDGLELTCQAVRSAREFTKTPHEIIVVDNASGDGTSDWLSGQADIKVLRSDKLLSYGAAINMGLHEASKCTKYLAVLNNDLIFTEGWDVHLIEVIEHPLWVPGVDKVGIAGPMSNHAAGFQLFRDARYNLGNLGRFAKDLELSVMRDRNDPKVMRAGFLSGFCWIMSRECYEVVGDMETFEPLGFEDNDYILRAELGGFASVIVRYAFVHHFGGQTTMRLNQDYAKRGLINRFPFYEKYLDENKSTNNVRTGRNLSKSEPLIAPSIHMNSFKPKKLVAGYRVKNVGRWFRRVLSKMSEIADEIVVFDDNSTDDTLEIAKSFDSVVLIHESEHPEFDFNEARDREELLQLCKSRNPDWIIITDGDEEMEEKFDRTAADKLMNPVKPHIFAYIFRYITHWDSEDMQRTDGIFGKMANVRMVRNLPNQHVESDHPQGFHCNSLPWIPLENVELTPYRIRHYGYIDPKDRKRKYDWYQIMDTDKRRTMIGAENYEHLIDTKVSLIKYTGRVTLGLAMIMRDEAENLEKFLDTYHTLFDEMVIVDTGSKDSSREIAKFYGAKVYEYPWNDDFGAARNYAKDKLSTDWVIQLDPDEMLGDNAARIYRMIEEPVLGYIFPVVNHLPSGKAFISENSRLYRNLPEICYAGTVHESVNESLSKVKGYGKTVFVANPAEALHHFGYLKHPVEVEKKLQKYAAICERNLAQNPNDGMAHFSLALHYLNEGNEEKGEYHFKQAMIFSPKLTQSHQQLANLYLRKARKCLETAVKCTNPAHPVYQSSMTVLNTIRPFADDMEIVGMPLHNAAEVLSDMPVSNN